MTLAISEGGSPTGLPFLCLHGLGTSRQETISTFSLSSSLRLLAPDLPGHGDSLAFDATEFSFDFFADQVVALLDKLALPPLAVGGQCLGAGVALNLALRYPDRINKLILMRPAWLDKPQPSHLSLIARVGRWLETGGEEHATMKLALHSDYQRLVARNTPLAEQVTALLDRRKDATSTQVLDRIWRSSPCRNLTDLQRLSHPTLVLTTPDDELHPQDIAQTFAEALPNSSLKILPPRYQDAKTFQQTLNEEIAQFLIK